MTVKELIDELQKFAPESEIRIKTKYSFYKIKEIIFEEGFMTTVIDTQRVWESSDD